MSFKVSVTPGIAVPEVIPMSVSVKVGKTSYTDNEAIFIAGSVDPVTKSPVTLQIRTPEGNLAGAGILALDFSLSVQKIEGNTDIRFDFSRCWVLGLLRHNGARS